MRRFVVRVASVDLIPREGNEYDLRIWVHDNQKKATSFRLLKKQIKELKKSKDVTVERELRSTVYLRFDAIDGTLLYMGDGFHYWYQFGDMSGDFAGMLSDVEKEGE